MHNITKANLEAAFAGESQAHVRYLIFADRAERDGHTNVARLFRAIAFAELRHATNHFKALDRLHDSAANLDEAIGGETFEVEEMYPAYQAVADLQEEKRAKRSMGWALEAEKVHAGLYQKARAAVGDGEDVALGKVHVCGFCGWTGEGEPPEKCPICGARREQFEIF
jgi:rubrerythrin